jgi:hypothetical protein
MADLAPRLKVTRLEVITNWGRQLGCELEFEDGINVIRGGNSLGKTTALKLINYALGAQVLDFIREIDQCDLVRLQISLNDKGFLISRNLNKETSKVLVKAFGSEKVEERLLEFSDFLLAKLKIPLGRVPQSGKKADAPLPIYFSNLLGLMYVSQDHGTEIQEKMQRQNDRMQRAIFELLLKLSGADSLELEVSKSQLEAQKLEISQEITTYKKLLQELNIPSVEAVNQEIARLQDVRISRLKERERILREMRGDSAVTFRLNETILQLDQKIRTISAEIAFQEEKLGEYRLSRNDVLNEQNRVRRYGSAQSVLSSFTFSQCPRCKQPITEDMKAHEAKDDKCMLCGRQIPTDQSVDLSKQIADLTDEARELTQLIERYEGELRAKRDQRDKWLVDKAIKDRELDEQSGVNYTSAFTTSVEDISRQIATLDEQIRQESKWLSFAAKLDERYKAIEKIDSQIKEIVGRMAEVNLKKSEDSRRYEHFEQYLYEFLSGLFRGFDHVRIDPVSYMPIVNGLDYQRFSRVQKNLTVLGYHYALLRYSLNHESRYPRFLLIDTPNKGDMDDDTFVSMMRKFASIKQTQTPFQLIVATRREVPEDLVDVLRSLDGYLLQPRQSELFGDLA